MAAICPPSTNPLINAALKSFDTLSDLIKKDPNNKEAHFNRALAYFETGNFEQALNDYIASNKTKNMKQIQTKVSNDFSAALINGLVEGGQIAAIEFLPSLCNTAYGLGQCLWCFVQQPVNATVNFCNSCYETGEAVTEYIKSLDQEKIDGMTDEIKQLYQKYDSLSDSEKGQSIGYCIGKYGVDIFAGSTTIKCVSAIKNLKNTNRLCNLESMVASKANQEAMTTAALKHAAERKTFLKNINLEWDKQSKHIPGKHNYKPEKSIFDHKDPQELLEKFGGKGRSIRGSFGEAGYQEIVDFKEYIGFSVSETTGVQTPTTWGKIHYSKNGAHIVPTVQK